jgi:hypothetical protein
MDKHPDKSDNYDCITVEEHELNDDVSGILI